MTQFKKNLKKKIKKILSSRLVIRILSRITYLYALLVGKTTRWQLEGVSQIYDFRDQNKNFILVGWHGRAMMMPYFARGEFPLDALVSLHQDGRIIAGLLRKFGLGTIGGSTTVNAKGAAMGLMRSLQEQRSICIIPDGPRGPRMQMTMSPLYYAQKTGLPIFFMVNSFKHAFIIEKAWDKMMIPLPFGRGFCKVSAPFYVDAAAGEAELETARQKLEDLGNRMLAEADTAMNRRPVCPAAPEEIKAAQQKRRSR